MDLEKEYIKNYTPLLENFLRNVECIDAKNCPEPFMPIYGKGYEKASTKIMFMGWETRNAHKLDLFINAVKQNPRDALFWFEDDFDAFDFIYWKSNFGKDFWSFNLRFLAKFYQEDDWKILYRDPHNKSHILNSFAWGNTDSIERFNVTAQGNNISHDTWNKIKEASLQFDNMHLILNTFKPNILILLCGDEKDEHWIFKDLKIEKEESKQDLWYYKVALNDSHTHVFWTYHPRGMPSRGIDYDHLISEIISIYSDNKQ